LNFFRTSWKGMGIFLCGSIRRPACENWVFFRTSMLKSMSAKIDFCVWLQKMKDDFRTHDQLWSVCNLNRSCGSRWAFVTVFCVDWCPGLFFGSYQRCSSVLWAYDRKIDFLPKKRTVHVISIESYLSVS
jgi:hypothetical protein